MPYIDLDEEERRIHSMNKIICPQCWSENIQDLLPEVNSEGKIFRKQYECRECSNRFEVPPSEEEIAVFKKMIAEIPR